MKENSFEIPDSDWGGTGDGVFVAVSVFSAAGLVFATELNKELMAFLTPAIPCSTAFSSFISAGLPSVFFLHSLFLF